MEGIYANGGDTVKINPKEYLDDLMLYKDKSFDFEETAQVFNLMVTLFEKAIENGVMVKAERYKPFNFLCLYLYGNTSLI